MAVSQIIPILRGDAAETAQSGDLLGLPVSQTHKFFVFKLLVK
jgi:hypothetical protein